MTGFGPIFQLQILGSICPCLEKGENKSARQAITAINKACRRVEWQPGSNSAQKGFLGSFFHKAASVTGGGSTSQAPCMAKIVLQDSGGDGQPELFVDPLQNQPQEGDGAQQQQQQQRQQPKQRAAAGFKLNIKLRRVDKVSLDEATGQIVLSARKVGTGDKAVAKELLRFTLLQQHQPIDNDPAGTAASEPAIPVTSDVRNEVMHHFMVLAEWERQRRADLKAADPDGYYDSEEDDEDQPNFIAARAQKAAHFHQREVELRETKRNREKRKAELVAASGGLKYTAIAMANMQQT